MTKFDELIKKFKDIKEELNKGVNMSYASSPNDAGDMGKNMNGPMNPGMQKPSATTGTSGGQGGMYRSENMEKELSGLDQVAMSECLKFDSNGQWSLDKVDPDENINIPHPKTKAKMANGVNKEELGKTQPPPPPPQSGITASGISAGFKGAMGMGGLNIKKEEIGDDEGTNEEANPKRKMRGESGKNKGDKLGTNQRLANPPEEMVSDGRGKVHIIKDEGTNEKANPSRPHNKSKFKVMDEVEEKESKKEKVSGLPYNGDDKKIHKAESADAKGHEEQRAQNKARGNGFGY